MYTEPNQHSRNLKLVSLLFILYWLLGLQPVDDSIRLVVASYKVSNPVALTWVAHLLLFYFAWRLYLSSRRKIRAGYRQTAAINQFQNKSSLIFRKLQEEATKHYSNNGKSRFEKKRASQAKQQNAKDFNNNDYSVNPSKLAYSSNKLTLDYQVQYEGKRLQGNDFLNGQIVYGWHRWLWFKALSFLKFMISKEEAPDYLIPWVLFIAALGCSLMLKAGISVHDFG